ncbi:hypothetical protein LTS10_013270 [Elasticomyces elasticus]|nr:hypothetical protein LTS10_013270 [Elasticomyces elasticus]
MSAQEPPASAPASQVSLSVAIGASEEESAQMAPIKSSSLGRRSQSIIPSRGAQINNQYAQASTVQSRPQTSSGIGLCDPDMQAVLPDLLQLGITEDQIAENAAFIKSYLEQKEEIPGATKPQEPKPASLTPDLTAEKELWPDEQTRVQRFKKDRDAHLRRRWEMSSPKPQGAKSPSHGPGIAPPTSAPLPDHASQLTNGDQAFVQRSLSVPHDEDPHGFEGTSVDHFGAPRSMQSSHEMALLVAQMEELSQTQQKMTNVYNALHEQAYVPHVREERGSSGTVYGRTVTRAPSPHESVYRSTQQPAGKRVTKTSVVGRALAWALLKAIDKALD